MADSYGNPYILRPIIQDVPLSIEEAEKKVVITCVEFWESNLYIGTSAAEVLHYVCIPGDGASDETFIQASRTQPNTVASQNLSKGVQQLLILPRSKKACILCNGTLTFHTLPELSPAPDTQTVSNVLWMGGMDLDIQETFEEDDPADFVLMSLRTRLRLLRVGEKVTSPKSLDYPGCLSGARRGRYACVASARAYALIDLENSQKIPLFPISSLDSTAISFADRQTQNVQLGPQPTAQSHSRNTSLSAFMGNLGKHGEQQRRGSIRPGYETPEPRSGATSPARPSSHLGTPQDRPFSPQRPDSALQARDGSPEKSVPKPAEQLEQLQPQVVSPISTEYLILTGTSTSEPGVGMFVNLEGDVVRGTLEFSAYPSKIVLDGSGTIDSSTYGLPSNDNSSYLFAAMERTYADGKRAGFEIHRWDDQSAPKHWLSLGTGRQNPSELPPFGVASAHTTLNYQFREIGESLQTRRFDFDHDDQSDQTMAQSSQDIEFAQRLGQASARIIVWYADKVYLALRDPILLQMNGIVEKALEDSQASPLDQSKLIDLFRTVSRQEARSEAEFLSLEFIRQKISLILFADLALNRESMDPRFDEQLFLDAGTDPRIILSMVHFLKKDIFKGPTGIMMQAGLASVIKQRFRNINISLESDPVLARPEDFDILGLIKKFLTALRQRKGYGSIVDEANVFASVDAALIHILLYQDQQTSLIPGRSSTLGAELYAIIDNPIECFDRAKGLLEEYRRLFALSRLYQSRRMSRKVLETWRRILDGEPDDGGGFPDGENVLKGYLINRSDRALVEEYGCWLARRNPSIGVQVFTDDTAKVKFTPAQVEELLRKEAPAAVKVYLEHLVFGKKNVQYANELISYYLDNVLSVLQSSTEALTLLAESYQTYRALAAPKPTYRQFITDNSIPQAWWHDRLRLLELLGGSYGAGFSYDVSRVLDRIQPFEEALVPESIILEGRQGQHLQALRLLIHGLGDYHTAINYCLLGGSSIFHPAETPDAQAQSNMAIPSHDEQRFLFQQLFTEFLSIQSSIDRLERTSELLDRFGRYFDVLDVLSRVPDDWAVELVVPYLTSALRQGVSERNESVIIKALAGVENLKVSQTFVEKVEKLGAHVIPATNTPASM